jgi:fluoroquinolone resistance protein
MFRAAFSRKSYEDEHFQSVSADNIRLEDTSFYRCRFTGCSLQYSIFLECLFEDCIFTDCNLSLAEMLGSTIIDTVYKDCKLVGINWGGSGKIFSASYSGCILNSSVFSDKNLYKFIFNKCSFVEASFTHCKLAYAVFDDCDMEKCQFQNVDLSYADFSTSRNYFVGSENNKLHKTVFSLPEACSLLGNLDIVLK